MRRGIVTGGAALALAGSVFAAAPATAEPVRMCDGNRGVIAKGIGCAQAFWLSDQARAGRQVGGWSVRGNSAGVVRLRRGKAWVKLRRVPRRSVAALLIAGLYVEHVHQPINPRSHGSDTIKLCADGRIGGSTVSSSGSLPTDPGPAWAMSAYAPISGSWKPWSVVEWRGGRTLELIARTGGGLSAPGVVLAATERVRLELRDDGTGTLRGARGAWPVTWSRGARCPA